MKTVAELKALQSKVTKLLFRPLDDDWRMQQETDGRPTHEVVDEIITPNNRLTAFERLEIYNRQYWFRVLDCLNDDYPGLRAIVGDEQFTKLCVAYLTKYPSTSYTLRNLGSKLERFLREESTWTGEGQAMAIDMARFEWSQTVAFDGAFAPPISVDDLLDTSPGEIRLGLQPYVSLLRLDFAVDTFLQTPRRTADDSLRGEASNAAVELPKNHSASRKLLPPKAEQTFLVVHRHENTPYHKRLEPAAFRMLEALRDGATLEAACRIALETDTASASAIQSWFGNWAQLGWFCRPPKPSPHE